MANEARHLSEISYMLTEQIGKATEIVYEGIDLFVSLEAQVI